MLCCQCGEEIESRCIFDKCPPNKVENDFQLSVKIGAYYKFLKQIEPKVVVSYHRSLHFQMDTQLSVGIIRRRLLDARYRRYTDKRKPIRNASQRKVRLHFANDYITWLSYDWKRIIWTDEAHFELFNRKNRTLVGQTRSESEKPFSFVPRMQQRGGSISLWACMNSEGISDLVFHDGRVNGETYIHVIGDTLTRFIKRRFNVNDSFMLMQDNAPSRPCNSAMKFFKTNGPTSYILVVPHRQIF